MGYTLAFVSGFLLALLLTGGLLGTFTVFGVARYRQGEITAKMEAERAQIELRAALQRARRSADRARAETRQAEEKLRQLREGVAR
jgi:hypothetical protein